MGIPSAQFQLLVNLVIDITLSGSLLILLALGLSRLRVRYQAEFRNQLWRMVMLGLLLAVFAAGLPRLHLGWIPASSGVEWVTSPPEQVADFHELAHPSPISENEWTATAWFSVFQSRAWVFWAGLLWLLGVAFFLSRFLFDWFQLQRLARQAKVLPLAGESESFRAAIGGDGASKIKLLLANREMTPMSWGFWRPKILLPPSAQSWSMERRELVLLHEWGHIQQKDFPYLMLSRILTVLLWFNPLVWIAARRLAQSREQACDELVLRTGVKPSVYADHLLEIARTLRVVVRGRSAALSMARFSELEGRLIAILDNNHQQTFAKSQRRLSWFLSIGMMMASFLAVSPWSREAGSLVNTVAIKISGLALSDEDWQVLKEEGIDAAFVSGLVDFGFRDLDLDKILYLRNSGVEAHHVTNQADLIFAPLRWLEDLSRVCMRADSVSASPKMALEIEGKTYYAMPRCSLLMHRRGFRMAVDPISGKMVDKADAIVAASPGGHVFYFESKANLEAFNRQR